MKISQLSAAFVLALALVVLLGVSLLIGSPPAGAAPAAAPTPVSANRADTEPVLFSFWNGAQFGASATSQCFDLSRFNKADVYYNVDVTDAQTATLKLKFGNSEAALVDGLTVVTATADASAIQQVDTFGKFTCIGATLSTTAPVTITVNALGK
jgi:hypothetical protein